MIIAARKLQEECQEMRNHLNTTFIDFKKAFDMVNRDGLWKVMHKFSYPEWRTHMVRQLHDGMKARVTDNGTVSEAFAVTNGVTQGCVMAPTIFSLMFSAVLCLPTGRPHELTTPTTDNYLIDAPPSVITDTILPPPPPAPTTVMNTTCPTSATSVATFDYL
ncbi:unnamed protein product [Schistocephalus solidus]|uniref:Reverse transcriptase domain-containing protein n=1 Tax=Schistocephalus solidus TaxID=70667 RepID=A0A183SQX9_SCHSO|nr:unnamed protein product [Schistocephalus solidus]